jgi:hypothetical protein
MGKVLHFVAWRLLDFGSPGWRLKTSEVWRLRESSTLRLRAIACNAIEGEAGGAWVGPPVCPLNAKAHRAAVRADDTVPVAGRVAGGDSGPSLGDRGIPGSDDALAV